jgi:hypothetical protein
MDHDLNETIDNILRDGDVEEQIDALVQEGWKSKVAAGVGAAISAVGAYVGYKRLKKKSKGGHLSETDKWVIRSAHWAAAAAAKISSRHLGTAIKKALTAKGHPIAGEFLSQLIEEAASSLERKGREITEELLAQEAVSNLHRRIRDNTSPTFKKRFKKYKKTKHGQDRLAKAYKEAKSLKLPIVMFISYLTANGNDWAKGLDKYALVNAWAEAGNEVDWIRRIRMPDFPDLDTYVEYDE